MREMLAIKRFVPCSLIAVILCVSTSSGQQDASSRWVRQNDKDGDGRLTVEEFPERWRQRFSKFDADGDGFTTVEEHRAEARARQDRDADDTDRFFRVRDRDRDGKISVQEMPKWGQKDADEDGFVTAEEYRVAAQTERDQAAQKTERYFRKLDKNGDDQITLQEMPERARKGFAKMDTDGDGVLTREEDTELRIRKARKKVTLLEMAERMKPPVPPTHADVPYGEHQKQRFDIWQVESNSPTPLVIYIHGGGFSSGGKRGVNGPLVGKLLDRDIAFASFDYRLTDVGPFPMQMHDCARALQCVRHHAAEYNIDPERIGLMGGSAGSGISQWLAFHEDMADADSPDPIARQSTRVRCAAPYAAQCSYDPRFMFKLFDTNIMHPCFVAFYGMESDKDVWNPKYFPLYEEASPITHLTADDPPIFLYYPQANRPLPEISAAGQYIHHPKFGFVLKEKMDELGIECTLRTREQALRFPDDEIVQFFQKHLTKD